MIIDAIFAFFLWNLEFFLSPIKNSNPVTLPEFVLSATQGLTNFYTFADAFLPINLIILILGTIAVFESSIGAYKIIKWIYKKIPGIN